MANKQFTMPWVIATVVAVLGILSPIGWEYYRSRSRLELQQITSTILVEKTDRLNKLRLEYDGREITCLRMLQFLLVNSGRRPIRADDVIRPTTLTFSEGVDVLDARLDAASPANVNPSLEVLPSNRSVRVSAPLLNPDDRVLFTLFVSGPSPVLAAEARIVGVKSLTFVDRVAELKQPPRRLSWTVYPVGLFTLLCLLGAGIAQQEVRKHRRLARLYVQDGNPIPAFKTIAEYADFVRATFSYMTVPERKRALNAIVKEDDPLSQEAQARIGAAIKSMLEMNVASHSARIGLLVIAVPGVWYLLARIL